ncbi:hypothetical protein [Clostridium fallax]|uniref:Uncharacterized protein n=1 Tax=Clostridium fallax TaxID=1533 RepID=A0A1M4YYN4_9CLOT|nr:hypothetical protein [Clostridium fallax]SHF10913.1 hypothetical protein SAMN05443638_1347 [Clostridium fallax]SQB07382.1 Amino acid permease [Clostridium fallax]
MSILLNLLPIIFFALIVIVLFNILKIFVFSKITINKWIVLAASIVAFIIPIVIGVNQRIVTLIFSGIFVILFLWFLDLLQYGPKKEKKIKIKPKAKPNRIKNMKKDD